jgi:hypothetical protein
MIFDKNRKQFESRRINSLFFIQIKIENEFKNHGVFCFLHIYWLFGLLF